MKIKLPKSKPLLFVFGILIGVFTILYSAYQLDLMDLGFGPSKDPKVVYGPVISDLSGGMYSILWVTDEPVISKVKYGTDETMMETETSYHYYRIDSEKVVDKKIELFHQDKNIESLSTKLVEIDTEKAPDLPFVGFGEVQGLSQNEGFVVVEADDQTYVSVVKDGRWSIDFPTEIKEVSQGTLHVVKDDVLFSTIINFKYIQPSQTIVLNKTYDRIKPQTSDRSIEGLVNDAYACEGDVGSWEITCPDGSSQTETDACTQDRFMATHDNGYDQWAFEACGCPLEGQTWTAECNDGTTFEESDMCAHDLFYRVHSDQGYSQWQTEACQGHGGPLELRYEQEGAWNRKPFEKTPPTVANQQPVQESLPPFLCCWGESGASYAVPTDEVENPQCLPQDYKIGEAQTSDGCEPLFNQPIDEIRKMIDEQQQNPQTTETPPPQNSYDPALESNDLRNYNSNYPSKEDSLGAYCTSAFPDAVNYWSQLIVYWSDVMGVDPNAAASIMAVESCGGPGARSNSGAQSLFQVMPYNFQAGEDPYDPDTNAKVGINFYRGNLERFDGDAGLAFAAYNGGPYGPVAGGYANQSNWLSETQRYYELTTGLYDDALNCGNSTSGIDNFKSQRGWCESQMAQLEQGPTFETTSKVNSACYEPDIRGLCANANCDDQIGQSCTTSPDSCVFGAKCIGGTCEHFPISGCPAPGHSVAFGDNNQTADEGSNAEYTTQPTSAPANNEGPIQVSESYSGGDYGVIEYGHQKGTGYPDMPAKDQAEYIVLHWTVADNDVTFGETYESIWTGQCTNGCVSYDCPTSCIAAHYAVDKDGTSHYIYPAGQTIFSAGESYINTSHISFENIGTGDGRGWSTLTTDQAYSNVQEIIRHVEQGNTVPAEQLKVIGHREIVNSGKIDPDYSFVELVCSELHSRGYKVKCNHGVDDQYLITGDSRVTPGRPSNESRALQFRDIKLIHSSYAQTEGYDGPGMYKVKIDGYQFETVTVHLVKDLESTTFYVDKNQSGKYESGEEIELIDKILTVEKISNDVAIDLDDYVNMVSFPSLPEGVSTAGDLVEYLNHQAADVVSVSRLHNGDWQTFQVRDGKFYSEDFEVEANETYFIKLKYQTTVIVDAGEEIVDQVTNVLNIGWNTVVMPSITENPTVNQINDYFDGGENIDAVFYWDGSRYVGATLEDGEIYGREFVLLQNRPYWVRVSD